MSLKTTYVPTEYPPFYVGSAPPAANGSLLATPLEEEIIITDLQSQQILHKLPGDGETITSLAITPDGTTLAVVSQSQQLRIFDTTTGEVTKQHKLSSPAYISCADPTSSLFAFGGSDGAITVWDIEGGYVTHSLKGHGATICAVAFHGELNSAEWRLASGDTMGTAKVWDLVKRKCVHTINEHTSAVRAVSFNSNGTRFLTAGRDGIVVVYDATKRYKQIQALPTHEQVECGGFMGDLFYTAGSSNVLRVWDIEKGVVASTRTPLKTTEELVIVDAISLDGTMLLVVSDQTLVEVEPQPQGEIPVVRVLAGNHGIIADLRYAGPTMSHLVLATNAPALRVVDPEHPMQVQLLEGHTDLLNALDVSPDGRWIATASKDNEARLWAWDDASMSFQQYAQFQGHAGSVTAVAMARTGSRPEFVVTGSADLTVKKWKVPTAPGTVKTAVYTRRAHEKDINALDVAPNDEFFASASYDKTAKIWSVETGETVGILRGHRRGLWDVCFYPYDKLVATASGDKTVKVWSLQSYTCVKTLEGHTNAVQRARLFNREAPQVLSTGADGLVKLWDYRAGEAIKTLDAHENRIWSVDVRDDGAQFVTADADGKLVVWHDNTEAELREKEARDKLRVQQDQQLANYMGSSDWANAFLLALTLDHSMRLHSVVRSCVESNTDPDCAVGNRALEKVIVGLDDDQLLKLFKKVRDWNVNFKFFEISQKVLAVVLGGVEADRLLEIKGLMKIIDAIVPYNDRHYDRVDKMVEETYVLDYAVEQMN